MERNALFLSMLDELTGRLNTKEEYRALRIAALLRALLSDPPLVHEINRDHRVALRFDVESSPWLGPPHPHTTFASAAIAPHPSSSTRQLNFDQVRKWEVLVVGGHRYNVLIHYCIGAALARLEATVAVQALVSRGASSSAMR